jgi:mannan endo-1,6-alpha-mannosidase
MTDICESNNVCNTDEKSFKAYLSRWMAASTQMAPFTYNTSYPLLVSSAKAAAAQCNGSPTGNVCGLKWYNNGAWDGTNGVGQQMAAMEVMLGTLIKLAPAPVTNSTGGTSVGDPTAGFNSSFIPTGAMFLAAGKKDKAGAWVLTAVLTVIIWGGVVYLSTDVFEDRKKPVVAGRAERIWREKGLGLWKGKGRMNDDADLRDVEETDAELIEVVPKGKEAVISPVSPVAEFRDRRSTPVYRGGDMVT